MASLAKARLSLGLVDVAVRIEAARDSSSEIKSVSVCTGIDTPHEPTKVRAPYVCDVCGPEHDVRRTVKKGVPTDDGYVIVTAEEVATLKKDTVEAFKKQIVMGVHPADEVDQGTQQGKALYYVVPESDSDNPGYALLRDMVAKHSELAFCAMFTPRSVAGLYRLRVVGGVLVMEERTKQGTLKPLPAIDAESRDGYIDMMEQVLPGLTTEFLPSQYVSAYDDKLRELVASREASDLTQTTTVTPVATAGDDKVLAALAAMLPKAG